MTTSGEDTYRNWLIRPVAITLLIMMITSLFYGFYSKDYQPLTIVSIPFGIMVGYVFGIEKVIPNIYRRNSD